MTPLQLLPVIWSWLFMLPHEQSNHCQSCHLHAGWKVIKLVFLGFFFFKWLMSSCFLLSKGGLPVTYIAIPWVLFYTMSSGSAQDVAVEHFLRDIERRSKRLHCAVIGCEEERSHSDMNLLYRKSRLDWRQRDQEGSKKRWVDYNRVQFSGNISLLSSVNEFNFQNRNSSHCSWSQKGSPGSESHRFA